MSMAMIASSRDVELGIGHEGALTMVHVGVLMVFIHFVAAISMAKKIGLIGFGSSCLLRIFSRHRVV